MWYFGRSPSASSTTSSPGEQPSPQPLADLSQYLSRRELRERCGSPGPLGTAQAVTPAVQQQQQQQPAAAAMSASPLFAATDSRFAATPVTAERTAIGSADTPGWLAAYTTHLEALEVQEPPPLPHEPLLPRQALLPLMSGAVSGMEEPLEATLGENAAAVGMKHSPHRNSPMTREVNRRGQSRRPVLSLTPKSIGKAAESLFDGLFGSAATPPSAARRVARDVAAAAAAGSRANQTTTSTMQQDGLIVFADRTNRLDDFSPSSGVLGGRPRLAKKAKKRTVTKLADLDALFDQENIPPPVLATMRPRAASPNTHMIPLPSLRLAALLLPMSHEMMFLSLIFNPAHVRDRCMVPSQRVATGIGGLR